MHPRVSADVPRNCVQALRRVGLAALNLWSQLNKIASAQVKAKREDLALKYQFRVYLAVIGTCGHGVAYVLCAIPVPERPCLPARPASR